MSETNIRIATAFVAGLAVGTGVTYIITKSKLEKKYQALADEEVASVKSMYERRSEETVADSWTEEDITFNEVKLVPHADSQESLRDKREVLTEEEVIQYNKIASNYQPDREEIRKERNNKVPYLITADEFMDDGIHEDEKVVLTFYGECETIADDDDDIMEPGKVAELLGNENLKHFGENPDDPDVIHIRNEAKGVDYELVRNPLSYAEVVLGVQDADWDTEERPNRKRPKKMRNDE